MNAIGHFCAADHVGKSIINTLSMLILESNLTEPVFHTPYKYRRWVTNGWLKEFRRVLQNLQHIPLDTFNTAMTTVLSKQFQTSENLQTGVKTN